MIYKNNSSDSIFILMATFNGEKYIVDQLSSFESQSYKNWQLLISDDGSTDRTLDILDVYKRKWGSNKISVQKGPKKGFCQNFLSMACNPSIKSNLYAFSDQDDVWFTDKLTRAVEYFSNIQYRSIPTVYCGRTQIVDKNLIPLGFSPIFKRPASFENAIVQSIAGGNTMVFNQAAKNLLEEAGIQETVAHDWWLYQLITGAGGVIYYDSKPSLLYRQHDQGLIGANSSFSAQLSRIRQALNNRFKNWNTKNYLALLNITHLLTEKNKETLKLYGQLRGENLVHKFKLFNKCGLYRQTRLGTIYLLLGCLISKI